MGEETDERAQDISGVQYACTTEKEKTDAYDDMLRVCSTMTESKYNIS